jgi:hypothetical protein
LGDHQNEVDFGIEGKSAAIFVDVVAQIGVADVIDQQVVLIGVVLFGKEVVLGEEHRQAELDLGENESLMGHSAFAAHLHHLLVFSFDDYVLFQRGRPLEAAILRHPHAVRSNVPVLNLRKVDGCEAAHFDFLYHCFR